MIKLC